jgi:uncharacterized protein (DUF305 family)
VKTFGRTALFFAALLLAPLGLAACGGSHSSHSSATVAVPSSASFSAADVSFATDMIPHHRQAVEMAVLALDPKAAASGEVMALATAIKGAQDPEIAAMSQMLTSWGQKVPAADASMGDMVMDGFMTAAQMKELAAATGPAFDKMWLTMMIAHHEGAITMADKLSNGGKSIEALSLAAQITVAQKAEIDQMNKLLGK